MAERPYTTTNEEPQTIGICGVCQEKYDVPQRREETKNIKSETAIDYCCNDHWERGTSMEDTP